MEIKIALFEPEIPQNTGNIARLCAGTDVELILIGKLGFSLSNKYLKRAGLDYWEHVRIKKIDSFNEFASLYDEKEFEYAFLSKFGTKIYPEIPESDKIILIFGNESAGLPDHIRSTYRDKLYKIPMSDKIRSHNLSNSVAIVLYDMLRRNNFKGLIC
ncbi:MAG: tRNA (cytidine(34)-2'-O)-methyltransferase [Calditerrivibrio sp.]|nr:tRNA (cytidine(34)-2'-O)-methyltransferase [Calditerrivibrio sp.]